MKRLPLKDAKCLLLIVFLLLTSLTFGVIDEETARLYFTQALKSTYEGDFAKAFELSQKALSGRVYVQELPYFWYLRSRLRMINNQVDKALEELKNFTMLVRSDDIDNLIAKVNYFRKLNLSPSSTFGMGYVNSLNGYVKGIEYFQTPTSLAVYGDKFALLDSKNRRIAFARQNRILSIKKVSKDLKQVFFDRSGQLYLLGEKALYNESEAEIISGLKVPYIAGQDREGYIYIIDFDRVVKYNPNVNKTVEFKLPKMTFALDAEMTVDRLYILDALSQEIDVYSLDRLQKINVVKVPEKIWNFEVTPYGDIIYLGKDKIVAGGMEFPMKDINFIEYSYPTLFLIKWKGNVVEQYWLKDDKPIFVNIDNLSFDDNSAYAYVRVEDLYGDELHYVGYALSMFEQDVYVPSDAYVEQKEVRSIQLNTCENELINYRLAGIKVFGKCSILSKFTGGLTTPDGLKGRLYWVTKWTYLKPVPPGIIKLSAKVTFKEQVYYDTMFYTNSLIKEIISTNPQK
ncbi:MAG: hypothetical protein ACUVQF_01220 [Fervidobacterium sp.]|uniref:hypothetical protein n=1 Tax=Fervidobacterium sp. TaxID=1871331 RepID=UPI0040491C74